MNELQKKNFKFFKSFIVFILINMKRHSSQMNSIPSIPLLIPSIPFPSIPSLIPSREFTRIPSRAIKLKKPKINEKIWSRVKSKIEDILKESDLNQITHRDVKNKLSMYFPQYDLKLFKREIKLKINVFAIHLKFRDDTDDDEDGYDDDDYDDDTDYEDAEYNQIESNYSPSRSLYSPSTPSYSPSRSLYFAGRSHYSPSTSHYSAETWLKIEKKIEYILKNSDLNELTNQQIKNELYKHFPNCNAKVYDQLINIKIDYFLDHLFDDVLYDDFSEPVSLYAWKRWKSIKTISVKSSERLEPPKPPKPPKSKTEIIQQLKISNMKYNGNYNDNDINGNDYIHKNKLRIKMNAFMGKYYWTMPLVLIHMIEHQLCRLEFVTKICKIISNSEKILLFDGSSKLLSFESKGVKINGARLCVYCQYMINHEQYRDITNDIRQNGIRDIYSMQIIVNKLKRFCRCHECLRLRDAIIASYSEGTISRQIYLAFYRILDSLMAN